MNTNNDMSPEAAQAQLKKTMAYLQPKLRKVLERSLRKRIRHWFKRYPWTAVGKKRMRFPKVT